MSGKRFLVWYWSNPGGGSRYAYCLARRLAMEFGADRVSLSLRADDGHIAPARTAGLRVFAADILSDRKRPLATAAALARSVSVLRDHIEQSGADAVLLAMNFAIASAVAMTCARPLVYFAHDPAPHPGDYTPALQVLTQRALLRRADAVVALSAHAETMLRTMTASKKIRLAPIGGVFEPVAAPRDALPDKPVRLLFVGRLLPYKGLDVLAQGLTAIAHRNDWRLTIAGAGTEAARAASLFGKFPQAEAVKSGWLTEETLLSLQQQHDVLLSPYISATQSGTIADSLALAAPVVATPVGALPEQVGDGGWIAERATGEAFGAALTCALDQRERFAEKSAAALAQARRFWSLNWDWLQEI